MLLDTGEYCLVWFHKSLRRVFREYRWSLDEIRVEKKRVLSAGHTITSDPS